MEFARGIAQLKRLAAFDAENSVVLNALKRTEMSTEKLAEYVGITLRAAQCRCQRLERTGRVCRRKDGKHMIWSIPGERKRNEHTTPSRTPTPFRELKRDPFAHMKLAMVTR